MRKIRLAIGSGLLLAMAAATVLIVGGAGASHGGPGFKTGKTAYLIGTAPGVVVDPILSTGDIIGSPATGYQMSGIPDGLGAYNPEDDHRGGDEFVAVMNHELGKTFPNNPPGVDARISRLEIDPDTRRVHKAEYLFRGDEGFERFCSATLAIIFGRPYYFTGEEAVPIPGQSPGPAHDGSSIVMDPESGMWRETAHFGHFQHENVVPVKLRKWVFLSTEDDFRVDDTDTPDFNERENSYLYAYIADDFNEALRGTSGSLYVWKSNDSTNNDNAAATKGESIPGHFEPIPQSLNTSSTALKAAAAARDAFRFDRLEDLTARPDVRGRMYFADTGKPPPTLRGRIYQLDLDPRNPTQGRLKMILNGDPPDNDDIVNPDNMDASEKVLVIQEDRESAFRGDIGGSTGFSRVLVYDFDDKTITPVARVATPATLRPGTWESSGVIDAGHVLGKNWWLLDVQAHSTSERQPGPDLKPVLPPAPAVGEDGQLLAIKIPGSQGGGGDDDDDDDDD